MKRNDIDAKVDHLIVEADVSSIMLAISCNHQKDGEHPKFGDQPFSVIRAAKIEHVNRINNIICKVKDLCLKRKKRSPVPQYFEENGSIVGVMRLHKIFENLQFMTVNV